MKRGVKIGFPILCIVVVGGSLIALSDLKKKADKVSLDNNNKMETSYKEENIVSGHGYQNLDGLEENEINKYLYENYNEVNNTSNKVNNTNTNKVNNTVSNNTTNTLVTSNNSKSEESEKSLDNTSDKEKAIALVEEEWGEDSSVYYTNEGMSSGLYIVAVRDKSNTSVKMFYKVDLKNNTVELDW